MILISMWGTILLSCVLPLKPEFQGFFPGIFLFAAGIALTVASLWNYAVTGSGEPVTAGLYRFSRNPIYVAYTITWYGAALSLGSWLLMFLHTVELITCHFLVLDEERFCLARYGERYAAYRARAPRYIWKL